MEFDEKIWEQVDSEALDEYHRNNCTYKGMLLYVDKKTRSRFGGEISAAQKGEWGIVIGEWTSSYGTRKLVFLDSHLRERGSTVSCVRFWGHKKQPVAQHMNKVHRAWMDKTYVPVLVNRKKKEFKRKGAGMLTENDDWVISRDRQSVLISLLSDATKTTWIKRDFVHPDDHQSLFQSSLKCCSIRVPLWLATKIGAY